MSEQTKNIMWMAEQLDFNVLDEQTNEQLRVTMDAFLESTTNPSLDHSVYPA